MNNIFLYVSDNAQGKTRKLVDIIEQCELRSELVVTNMSKYDKIYIPDGKKFEYFKKHIFNDSSLPIILNEPVKNSHDKMCRELVSLLYSSGDVLVLDELDVHLTAQEIINICDIISQIAHLWKNIYVTGYNMELLRMFSHIDDENDVETYDENVYLVSNGTEVRKLTEEETYEYFNSIRG